MKQLKGALHGEYAVLAADGWKDQSRDSVNGVNLSISGKVRFILNSEYNLNLLAFGKDVSY